MHQETGKRKKGTLLHLRISGYVNSNSNKSMSDCRFVYSIVSLGIMYKTVTRRPEQQSTQQVTARQRGNCSVVGDCLLVHRNIEALHSGLAGVCVSPVQLLRRLKLAQRQPTSHVTRIPPSRSKGQRSKVKVTGGLAQHSWFSYSGVLDTARKLLVREH